MFLLLYITISQCLMTDVQFDQDFTWSTSDIVTNNNTYRIMNLSSPYYYINITLSKQDANFYLIAKPGKAIDSYTDQISDDTEFDLISLLENRITRFLKMEASGQIIYVTTTGMIHQRYNIMVRGSQQPICNNDCSNNGLCYDSGCSCFAQYIGDDCHQEAQVVPFNQDIAFSLNPVSANFFYTPFGQDQQNKKFTLTFEVLFALNQTNSSQGMYIFIEKKGLLYIPIGDTYTPNYQQFVVLVILDSGASQIVSMDNQDSSIMIFAALQFDQFEQTYLKISFGEVAESPTTSSMAVIIIVVTIATAVIIVIIVICVCRRMRRDRILRSLSQHRMQNLGIGIVEMAPIKNNEEQIINRLASVKESDLNPDDNCAICLEPLQGQIEVRQTPCHHNFHSKCLKMWLEKHKECPNCRTSLNLKDLLQK